MKTKTKAILGVFLLLSGCSSISINEKKSRLALKCINTKKEIFFSKVYASDKLFLSDAYILAKGMGFTEENCVKIRDEDIPRDELTQK